MPCNSKLQRGKLQETEKILKVRYNLSDDVGKFPVEHAIGIALGGLTRLVTRISNFPRILSRGFNEHVDLSSCLLKHLSLECCEMQVFKVPLAVCMRLCLVISGMVNEKEGH